VKMRIDLHDELAQLLADIPDVEQIELGPEDYRLYAGSVGGYPLAHEVLTFRSVTILKNESLGSGVAKLTSFVPKETYRAF
jgi:hypothetical protein